MSKSSKIQLKIEPKEKKKTKNPKPKVTCAGRKKSNRSQNKKPDPKLTIKYIDLFAGTGGFSLALKTRDALYECVFANDMEKSSQKIYQLNYPNHNFHFGNIHDLDISEDIPKHDLLCAGFPCQPFSIAGEGKGFGDKRSNVFWKLLNILEYHNPRFAILENVKNLKSHDKGNTFKTIKNELEKLGYQIKYEILDTSILTEIPHHRERIYIICFRDTKDYEGFKFDFESSKVKQIKALLQSSVEVDDKFYYTEKLKVYPTINQQVIKTIDQNVLYQYRRYYVRENKSNLCPTLTANMGSGGHNVPLLRDDRGVRKLTPRECFNLQGFPQSYKFPPNLSNSALYKLAGNAISVPIVELIGGRLLESGS